MKGLNFRKNTIQGTIWGVVNKFAAVAFPFVVRTIIINKLGAEYAGLSTLFTSILQMLSLADLGFGSAIVYAMYKPIAEEDVAAISALLCYFRKVYFYIGMAIMGIGLLIMPFINKFITGDIPDDINIYYLFLIYLVNTSISYLCLSYRASILSAYQREADNARIQLVTNSIMYMIQIFVLLIFENYYAYIIFLPIFTLVYNVIRYLYVVKKYPLISCKGNITKKQKDNIRGNIFALLFHKIGHVTVNTLDNVVISSFLGLVLLAQYNNYYYLISAITSLIMIFFGSITAGLGNRLLTLNEEKNKFDFYNIFYINALLVSVCTVCFFSMFQDFIEFWIGKEYQFDAMTMVLICIYFYIHTIRRTVISYRDAAGMWVDNKWQPIVSAIVNLSLNLTLIRIIGIKGVVISTIVSMIVVDIPWETKRLISKLFDTSTYKYYMCFLLYTFLTIVSCFFVWPMINIIASFNVYARLLLESVFSIIVGCVVFYVGTRGRVEQKAVLDQIKNIYNKLHCK